jgi:hypothetical protein
MFGVCVLLLSIQNNTHRVHQSILLKSGTRKRRLRVKDNNSPTRGRCASSLGQMTTIPLLERELERTKTHAVKQKSCSFSNYYYCRLDVELVVVNC